MQKRAIVFLVILAVVLFAAAIYFVPRITPVDLKLDAVKLDSKGNETGTAYIRIEGSKYDYLFQMDRIVVSIAPFDGYAWVKPSGYVTDGREIQGAIQSSPSGDYLYASYSGAYSSENDIFFAEIGFSPDLDRWILCNLSDEVYYVASVSGDCTVSELTDYFKGLISIPSHDDQIGWTMHGTLVDPDGNEVSSTEFSIDGNFRETEDDNHELNLSILFPESFQYWYDRQNEPSSAYLSVFPKYYGLRYFMVDSFSYDHAANRSVKSSFALCTEKEYAIFYWDDGTGRYLVASTDPSTDPNDVLEYFGVFRDIYNNRPDDTPTDPTAEPTVMPDNT